MATTTVLDVVCVCGSPRACHRTALRWGQAVRTTCRHCPCGEFREAPPQRAAPQSQVVTAYDAWVCLECGARYGQDYNDHGCGPLTPVTVTITAREVPA